MKRFFLTSTLLCLGFLLWSQDFDLTTFNEKRLKRQKTAMTVLGSWAVGNIAVGAALQGKAEGNTKYFHQMNMGWNAINLAIAGIGYWNAMNTDPATFDSFQTIQQQHQFQKILLFNAGLDIGYMLGGAYLIERSKNTAPDKKPERLKGFGQSIILQGGFLFAFDLATYFIMSSSNDELKNLTIQLAPATNGIGLQLVF